MWIQKFKGAVVVCEGGGFPGSRKRLEESLYFTVSQPNPIEITAPREYFTEHQSELNRTLKKKGK